MCQHQTCAKITAQRQLENRKGFGGVACAIINKYMQIIWTILLGLETSGQYDRLFNLCAGRVDPSDNGCYLAAATRELFEEFAIDAPLGTAFDAIFKGNDGSIRYIMHRGTPVFIGVVNGLSRNNLNPIIMNRMQDPNVSHSMKEMARVEWFDLQNKTQIEQKNCSISAFASSVMDKIDVNNL